MQSKGRKVIKTYFDTAQMAAISFFLSLIYTGLCDIPKQSILRALQYWYNICLLKNAI